MYAINQINQSLGKTELTLFYLLKRYVTQTEMLVASSVCMVLIHIVGNGPSGCYGVIWFLVVYCVMLQCKNWHTLIDTCHKLNYQ